MNLLLIHYLANNADTKTLDSGIIKSPFKKSFSSIKESKTNKEEFLANLFYFMKRKKYALKEVIDFGFNEVNDLTIIIEKKQFSVIKTFIKNNFFVKNSLSNIGENSGIMMLEFDDSTFIQIELIWSFDSKIDKILTVKEVLNSTATTKDGLKVINNYVAAKYIGLLYFVKNERIISKYKKYAVSLMRSTKKIDKIIYSLYFDKNISKANYLLYTEYI